MSRDIGEMYDQKQNQTGSKPCIIDCRRNIKLFVSNTSYMWGFAFLFRIMVPRAAVL